MKLILTCVINKIVFYVDGYIMTIIKCVNELFINMELKLFL